MYKADEKYSMLERGTYDTNGHLIIVYKDTLWYFHKRTEKRLYYISADRKRMIVWNYTDDFKVCKIR
jgi:hypothetical protein